MRQRREDVVNLCQEEGWINIKDYDLYLHLNRKPNDWRKPKNDDLVCWKNHGDMIEHVEKLVVWYFESTWPTTKEAYLARGDIREDYKNNGMNRENITLRNTIDKQRAKFLIDRYGPRPENME